ncbi:TIGR00159 family protein [Eremococcus coleocola ACS-139-V-Col8]|uniref:Diadenylate cyclase n=1 Tax=Eremococcus coleocola ACS-139-V-Col8 TaxID=908337 RepID=E4KN20_9LACT|nr:TIGR00159 family protein [Eremococcus coleocola ACS-139-V-Col8]
MKGGENVLDIFNQFLLDKPIVRILDILIVWFIIYRVIVYARGTQMMNLLKGLAIFIAIKFIAQVIGLQTIDWILSQILSWGVIAVIVLFQPELRRFLEILGRDMFRKNRNRQNDPDVKLISDLEYALSYMSKRKIGALIAIEGNDELQDIIDTGIVLDAEVSNQLLINIFIPNTPLHDGAVVIKDYKAMAASCYLPLSENGQISKELGTRHRAGIGLSETKDALVLIVSEETGDISLVKDAALVRGVDKDELHRLLELYLLREEDEVASKDYLTLAKEFIFGAGKVRGDKHENE